MACTANSSQKQILVAVLSVVVVVVVDAGVVWNKKQEPKPYKHPATARSRTPRSRTCHVRVTRRAQLTRRTFANKTRRATCLLPLQLILYKKNQKLQVRCGRVDNCSLVGVLTASLPSSEESLSGFCQSTFSAVDTCEQDPDEHGKVK